MWWFARNSCSKGWAIQLIFDHEHGRTVCRENSLESPTVMRALFSGFWKSFPSACPGDPLFATSRASKQTLYVKVCSGWVSRITMFLVTSQSHHLHGKTAENPPTCSVKGWTGPNRTSIALKVTLSPPPLPRLAQKGLYLRDLWRRVVPRFLMGTFCVSNILWLSSSLLFGLSAGMFLNRSLNNRMNGGLTFCSLMITTALCSLSHNTTT